MAEAVLPDAASSFGERVRRRLREERVIWLTTVGADGTPQPNPVWFLWGDESFLVYNRPDARRLQHVRSRPHVSLHFDGNRQGGDIVVFTGRAQVLEGRPPPDQVPEYVAKYRDAMLRVSGDLDAFAAQYPVPLLVRVRRVRGF
jgi:PPOX class probable F420-dependent enzyme